MNLDELTEALLDEAEPILKSKKDVLFKPTFVAISSPPGYSHFEGNFPKDPSSATSPGHNYNGLPLSSYYKYTRISKVEKIIGNTHVESYIDLDPSHSDATATTFAATINVKGLLPIASYGQSYGYKGPSWNLNIGGYSPGNLAAKIAAQHKEKFTGKNGFTVVAGLSNDTIYVKLRKTVLLKRGGVALDIQKALYALAKDAEALMEEIVKSLIDTITTDKVEETTVEIAGAALAKTFEDLKVRLAKFHGLVNVFDKVKIPKDPKEFAMDILSPDSAGHWVNIISSFQHLGDLGHEVQVLANLSKKLNSELVEVHTALKKLVAEA